MFYITNNINQYRQVVKFHNLFEFKQINLNISSTTPNVLHVVFLHLIALCLFLSSSHMVNNISFRCPFLFTLSYTHKLATYVREYIVQQETLSYRHGILTLQRMKTLYWLRNSRYISQTIKFNHQTHTRAPYTPLIKMCTKIFRLHYNNSIST